MIFVQILVKNLVQMNVKMVAQGLVRPIVQPIAWVVVIQRVFLVVPILVGAPAKVQAV